MYPTDLERTIKHNVLRHAVATGIVYESIEHGFSLGSIFAGAGKGFLGGLVANHLIEETGLLKRLTKKERAAQEARQRDAYIKQITALLAYYRVSYDVSQAQTELQKLQTDELAYFAQSLLHPACYTLERLNFLQMLQQKTPYLFSLLIKP